MSDPNTQAEDKAASTPQSEDGKAETATTGEKVTPLKKLGEFMRSVARAVGVDHFLRITAKRETLEEAANAQHIQHDQLAELRKAREDLKASPTEAPAQKAA